MLLAGRVGLHDGAVVGGAEDDSLDAVDVTVELEEVLSLSAGRPQLGNVQVGEGVQGGAVVLEGVGALQQGVIVGGNLDTERNVFQQSMSFGGLRNGSANLVLHEMPEFIRSQSFPQLLRDVEQIALVNGGHQVIAVCQGTVALLQAFEHTAQQHRPTGQSSALGKTGANEDGSIAASDSLNQVFGDFWIWDDPSISEQLLQICSITAEKAEVRVAGKKIMCSRAGGAMTTMTGVQSNARGSGYPPWTPEFIRAWSDRVAPMLQRRGIRSAGISQDAFLQRSVGTRRKCLTVAVTKAPIPEPSAMDGELRPVAGLSGVLFRENCLYHQSPSRTLEALRSARRKISRDGFLKKARAMRIEG